MRIQGVFGVLYIAAEWLMRLAMVNLLWIILNIPIVFISISIFIADSIEELFQIGTMIALLTPFLFFPATTAMVDLIRKWVMENEDIPIFKPFFKAYRKHYIKSMLGGLIITLIWIIFIVDFYYFTQSSFFIVEYILYFLFIFLLVFTLYFFSAITYKDGLKLRATLKLALTSTISRPFLSFAIAVISMIAIFISFNILTFLIPLLVGSFIALVSTLAFHYTVKSGE